MFGRTTHCASIDRLREQAAETTVVEKVRYVRDPNLVTAAGVSAGIDMSLWLVGQLWDVEHARTTQKLMQYGPRTTLLFRRLAGCPIRGEPRPRGRETPTVRNRPH